MRNLALALFLVTVAAGGLLAPHEAWAKKHAGKKGRSAKAKKHKASKQARHALPPADSDTLVKAVSHKREDPMLTAAAPPAAPPPAAKAPSRAPEPVVANPPMNMGDQASDDEVPGSHKKR
jgi:hypothetical protein